MSTRKPTKAERENRAIEAQQQARQLHEALTTIARGISKTGDRELIDAWDWFLSFWRASLEQTVELQEAEQRVRKARADSQRKFSDEEFERAAATGTNDKGIARILKVHVTTIASYRAAKSRKPSLTEEIIQQQRAERMRTIDDLREELFATKEDLGDAQAEIQLAKNVNSKLSGENAALRTELEKLRKRK